MLQINLLVPNFVYTAKTSDFILLSRNNADKLINNTQIKFITNKAI